MRHKLTQQERNRRISEGLRIAWKRKRKMAPEDNPADDDEHGECRHEIECLKDNCAVLQGQLKAAKELVSQFKQHAEKWERLHDARTAELKRTQEVLAAHRRWHSKAGCPGRPECYVCAEEEFNIDMIEYRRTP